MPPGPIRGLRFIHNAIRVAARRLEQDCAAMADPSDAASVADAAHLLTRAVRGHAIGEDKGYFPTLAERLPNAVESFSLDHHEELARLDEIDRLVDHCGTDADLQALKRATVALHEHLEHHMHKEEVLLWPQTEALFSPPEQGGIVGAIVAEVPPADMPVLVPWIIDLQSDEEAEAYVRVLQRIQPPERFAVAVGWIRDGVQPARWADLTARIPEIAG